MQPLHSKHSAENRTFTAKKSKILAVLGVDDDAYTDASPKGNLDVPIRGLIAEINAIDGLVTTSSCSGRVSVFVDGVGAVRGPQSAVQAGRQEDGPVADDSDDGEEETKARASVGGKGGGRWLFVSHEGDAESLARGQGEVARLLGLRAAASTEGATATPEVERCWSQGQRRLVHFKFEPMILHILTASLETAQLVLGAAQQAGFRESGVSSVTSDTPIVAVRTNGLALESILGAQVEDKLVAFVDHAYIAKLWDIAEARFQANTSRIKRFQELMRQAFVEASVSKDKQWEDEAVRSRRKREEGLQRQALVRKQKEEQNAESMGEESHVIFEDIDAFR